MGVKGLKLFNFIYNWETENFTMPNLSFVSLS